MPGLNIEGWCFRVNKTLGFMAIGLIVFLVYGLISKYRGIVFAIVALFAAIVLYRYIIWRSENET